MVWEREGWFKKAFLKNGIYNMIQPCGEDRVAFQVNVFYYYFSHMSLPFSKNGWFGFGDIRWGC